jgi:hypothetical protein
VKAFLSVLLALAVVVGWCLIFVAGVTWSFNYLFGG